MLSFLSDMSSLWAKGLGLFGGASSSITQAVEGAGVHMSLFRFVTGLAATVPLSAAQRLVPKGKARHVYGALSSLAVLGFAYGRDVGQFVVAGSLVYAFMKFFPKKCGYLTWATIFSYQVYLHYLTASQDSWNQGNIDFTGSFMMITLKLISVAMDYQDGVTGNKKQNEHSITRLPSVLEFLGYLGCCQGLMVGPHFYFDEYMRYSHNVGEYDILNHPERMPTTWFPALKAFVGGMLCAGVFAYASVAVPRGAIMFYNDPSASLFKKMGLAFVCNVGYRSRFYFAWLVAEAAYTVSGFGFSGFDKDGKPDFSKAINAPIYQIETNPSAAQTVTKWNVHTGLWLRNYVYRRIGRADFSAILLTQVICGLWHGFSLGYLVFFVNTAIMIQASRIFYRIQSQYLPKSSIKYTNQLHRILTVFNLNYVSGSYAAGDAAACMVWFKNMYYIGHIEMITLILLGMTVFPKRKMGKPRAAPPAGEADQAKKAK